MDLSEYRRRIGRYFLSLEPSKKSMDFYNGLMSTATPEKEMLRSMNNKLDILTDAVIKMQVSLQGVTEEVSFLALCRVGETAKNPPLPPCSVASTGAEWVPSADFFGDLLHCTADAFPAAVSPPSPPVPSVSVPPKQVESPVPTLAVPLPSSASVANPHLD